MTQLPNSRLLDSLFLNKFGDDRVEQFALSVQPTQNWGGKGPHLLIALYRDDGRYPEESAAVKRSEVVELHAAITAWLKETEE